MSREYTTGFRTYRCPECLANWSGPGEVRVYDPETGEDRLIKSVQGEEHPKNECGLAPQPNRAGQRQQANAQPYDTPLDGADVFFVMHEENVSDEDEWVGKWRIMGCATTSQELRAMARKTRGLNCVVVSAGTAFHYANRMAAELPPIPAATPLWKYW